MFVCSELWQKHTFRKGFSKKSIIKYLRIHRNKNAPSNIISAHCDWDANAFQFDAKLYSHLKSFSAAPTFVTPKSLVLSAVRGNITKLWEIRSEAQRKQERTLFQNCTIIVQKVTLENCLFKMSGTSSLSQFLMLKIKGIYNLFWTI